MQTWRQLQVPPSDGGGEFKIIDRKGAGAGGGRAITAPVLADPVEAFAIGDEEEDDVASAISASTILACSSTDGSLRHVIAADSGTSEHAVHKLNSV